MGDNELLTTGEFGRWTAHIDKRFDKLDALQTTVDQHTTEIANIKESNGKSKMTTSYISALVAGIISGLASLATNK